MEHSAINTLINYTVKENGDKMETFMAQENGSEVCSHVDSLFGPLASTFNRSLMKKNLTQRRRRTRKRRMRRKRKRKKRKRLQKRLH